MQKQKETNKPKMKEKIKEKKKNPPRFPRSDSSLVLVQMNLHLG